MSRRGSSLPLLLLLAAAFSLYLWGISWGLPAAGRAWDHDEILPRQVTGTSGDGLALGAWPVKYPPFHARVLMPFHAAVLRLESGSEWLWAGVGSGFLAPVEDTLLFFTTRGVSLLMATATVLLLYLAAREALGRTASLLAASLYAFSLPTAFYAKMGNLDVPYVFWFALSLWLFLRLLARWRMPDAIGLGLAAAMAVGTKDQAYALYVLAPLPLLLALRRHDLATGRRRALLLLPLDRRVLAAALAFALLFLAGHLGGSDLSVLRAHIDRITGPASANYRLFAKDLGGQLQNFALAWRNLRFALGDPASVACLLGLVLALGQKPARPGAAVGPRFLLLSALTLAVSYALTFIAVILYSYDRFLMPVCLLLSLFGGLALERLLELSRLPRALRVLPVAAVVLAGPLRVVAMDLRMANDSRYAVEDWIESRLDAAGSVLAVGNARLGARLPTVTWRELASGGGELLSRQRPRFVVVNVTELLEMYPEHAKLWHALRSGRLGYDLRLRHRHRAPSALFDPRGATGSLFFIDPELEVFERQRSAGGIARYAALLGKTPAAPHLLAERLRDAGLEDRAERLDRHLAAAHPEDALAEIGLALDLAARGCVAEAKLGLEAAASRRPEDVALALALSRFQLLSNDFDQAGRSVALAAALGLEAPDLALLRAQAAAGAGRSTAASAGLHVLAADAERRRDPDLLSAIADVFARLRAPRHAALARESALRAHGTPALSAASPAPTPSLQRATRPGSRRRDQATRGAVASSASWLDGAEPVERHPALGPFRWTHACAQALVEEVHGDAILRVRYRCGLEAARKAWIAPGGLPPTPLPCGQDGTRTVTLRLPLEAWGGSLLLPVELRVEPPFRPAEAGQSEDTRELGLQLLALEMEPDPRDGTGGLAWRGPDAAGREPGPPVTVGDGLR